MNLFRRSRLDFLLEAVYLFFDTVNPPLTQINVPC